MLHCWDNTVTAKSQIEPFGSKMLYKSPFRIPDKNELVIWGKVNKSSNAGRIWNGYGYCVSYLIRLPRLEYRHLFRRYLPTYFRSGRLRIIRIRRGRCIKFFCPHVRPGGRAAKRAEMEKTSLNSGEEGTWRSNLTELCL